MNAKTAKPLFLSVAPFATSRCDPINYVKWITLADGLYHIEGLGEGEKKGNQFYGMNGDVITIPKEKFVTWNFPSMKCERCSKWSDLQRMKANEKTEEGKKKEQLRRAQIIEAEQRAAERQKQILGRARKKLTKAEYTAIFKEGYNSADADDYDY